MGKADTAFVSHKQHINEIENRHKQYSRSMYVLSYPKECLEILDKLHIAK